MNPKNEQRSTNNDQRITIQNVTVPRIGLGTYGLRGAECEAAIATALEVGYRHIDTAKMYANEASIGNALKKSGIPRSELFITTKVWPDCYYDRNKFHKSVTDSLKDLRLEEVDLLLLHWPKDEDTNIEATEYLLECLQQGYAKNIGVSNFSISQLELAMDQAPVFCNQIKYHPYANQAEMIAFAKAHDILITAYSPLREGELWHDEKLNMLGAKYEKTAVQIALRWIIQQDGIAAIPKALSEKHQKENLDIFDFELSEDDMRSLF